MPKRETGFYWIKSYGGWQVAHWNAKVRLWGVAWSRDFFLDDEFQAIHETRLTPPEEN